MSLLMIKNKSKLTKKILKHMNKRVLIFMREDLLEPAGGPAAVCYFYKKEQELRNENYFEFLQSKENHANLHEKEKLLDKLPKFLKSLYFNTKCLYKTIILLKGKYPVDYIDINQFDIIHFHDALSLFLYKNQLKEYKGKVILQSHTPQPQRQELIANLPVFVRKLIPDLEIKYEKIDRYAFERADFIIFPCSDAEEHYVNNWSYFRTIKEKKVKSFRYVLTGIPECFPQRNRNEVLAELNIEEKDFIVCYVGRHNEVKGYDNLKKIGKKYLEIDKDAWIVCAGKEEPLYRLKHNRWIEIGWTKDAYSYIAASDVFILPNRETYFDIVMLEVLSLGKIIIASRTGGNKFFEKAGCEGVFLYDTIEEALELLKKVRSMTKEQRIEIGQKNYVFYKKNNTVASMYESYIKILNEISILGK